MAKVDYSISTWGELCLPAIIIIHSTNVEVVVMLSKLKSVEAY